mmetsp:Transcript_54449/g.122463  ORF Transcript_54449/g.122463 Transcript_54449/m.122463 type:complete len:264 (+) Transcript_54449:166-957(+)
MVARLEPGHALTDALNDARGLMPKDAGEEALGVEAVEGVCVRVAESDGNVLDAHLPLLRRCHLHLHELQGLLGLEGDRREALDLLPGGIKGRIPVGLRGVHRGCRQHAGIWAPADEACELRRVVLQVILDKCGDEEVRVIEALLHAERQRNALLVARGLQRFGLQLLLQEIVSGALVNEQPDRRSVVLLHELNGVVLLPALLVVPEVQREGLLAPRGVRRIGDRGEGRDGPVLAWVLQRNRHCAVSSHAVAHDADAVGDHWEL